MNYEKLSKLLLYEPTTGIFTWIDRGQGRQKIAGSSGVSGKRGGNYIKIGYNNECYQAHRLAWLFIYGELPKGQIDHINGDGTDNRIENLRDVTPIENAKNRCINKNNTSGTVGVYRSKDNYIATIFVNGKSIHLGTFKNIIDAICTRKMAEFKYGFTIR